MPHGETESYVERGIGADARRQVLDALEKVDLVLTTDVVRARHGRALELAQDRTENVVDVAIATWTSVRNARIHFKADVPLPFLKINKAVRLDDFVARADDAGHARDTQPLRDLGLLLCKRRESDAGADLLTVSARSAQSTCVLHRTLSRRFEGIPYTGPCRRSNRGLR